MEESWVVPLAKFDGFGNDGVEEIAVVRDNEQGAFVFHEGLL